MDVTHKIYAPALIHAMELLKQVLDQFALQTFQSSADPEFIRDHDTRQHDAREHVLAGKEQSAAAAASSAAASGGSGSAVAAAAAAAAASNGMGGSSAAASAAAAAASQGAQFPLALCPEPVGAIMSLVMHHCQFVCH